MKIAILGYGVVGKGVEKIADENGITVRHILMRESDELTKDNMTKTLDTILTSGDVDCIIECIGGNEPAFTYVKRCLKRGLNVISSNKKMIVNHFPELIHIAKEHHAEFLFSAACGGAIPWLNELSRIAGTDELYEFAGIMNGTSNYILSKMADENLSFRDALSEAQAAGFAEKDPGDDIDGIDTANKTILSMGIGFQRYVQLKHVFVKGIRAFGLPDLHFAKENGYKCVLLGRGNAHTLRIVPTFVKKSNIFYGIRANFNCFCLQAKNFGSFSLTGQGAGSLPTASNIIRDLHLLKDPYQVVLKDELVPDYDSGKHVFYFRTDHDVKSRLISRALGDYAYITNAISIRELETLIHENDFVGEIEDD